MTNSKGVLYCTLQLEAIQTLIFLTHYIESV